MHGFPAMSRMVPCVMVKNADEAVRARPEPNVPDGPMFESSLMAAKSWAVIVRTSESEIAGVNVVDALSVNVRVGLEIASCNEMPVGKRDVVLTVSENCKNT